MQNCVDVDDGTDSQTMTQMPVGGVYADGWSRRPNRSTR